MTFHRFAFAFWLALSTSATGLPARELYFVDAHSQVDQRVEDLGLIIRRMDEAGVHRTILAARSGRRPEEIVAFSRIHPARIVPAVRTKSEAYQENSPRYYKMMRKQLGGGTFRAMAEVLLYHARKGGKAPEVVVYPDDARARFALNAAIENRWPFVLHIEFAAIDDSARHRFMSAMKTMLDANRKHPFALNQMGQLDAAQVRALIDEHENLYFLSSHANPAIIEQANQPWQDMFDGETLSAQWKALMVEHPDRIVFALDNVWARHWKHLYAKQMDYWRRAVADLPTDVAHAFAHGNAERLWRLPPKHED